jgi:hypothetical protein
LNRFSLAFAQVFRTRPPVIPSGDQLDANEAGELSMKGQQLFGNRLRDYHEIKENRVGRSGPAR